MSFYSIYRIVKDIIRTIFGHRFWRKLLIVCLIAFGIWFFMHSKGYCVEETEDVNYKVYSYYDNVVNDFILRSVNNLSNLTDDPNFGTNLYVYFYYGNVDGSSYLNGQPINKTKLYYFTWSKNYNFNATATTYDYLGNSNFPISVLNNRNVFSLDQNGNRVSEGQHNVNVPLNLLTYENENLMELLWALKVNDTQAIIDLLEEIKDSTDNIEEALTSEDYDENDVSIGSTAIDNVTASTDGMFTTIFTNFNNAVSGGVSELIIPLPHTNETITIPSDIVSSHLGNFAYLVQAFWMYVFGLYTWRFVNNLIHRIKDGSILDGFKSDGEVITNTML